MPRLRALMSTLLVSGMMVIGLAAGAQAEAAVGGTSLPFAPTIRGANGQTSVAVTLPPGAVPIRITGQIRSTYADEGVIVVTAGAQAIAEVPAVGGGTIDAAIPADSGQDGVIALGIQVRLVPTVDCRVDEGSTATFTDALLTYWQDLSPPTTIGTFFSPGVSEYVVQVGTDAADDEVAAALNAVATLSHRVQSPTTVTLRVGHAAAPPDTQTRLVIVRGDPDATGSGGTLTVTPEGALLVTAAPDQLGSAVLALDEPALDLVSVSTLTDVVGTADWSPITRQTSLADFGVSHVSMSGIGTVEVPIGVNQPAFGGSLSDLSFDLVGVATPIPSGGSGRLDFLWNGVLVSSQEMGEEADVALTVRIQAAQLQRNNVLTVQMSYIPPGGSCERRPLPARFDLDTNLSTLTPTFGPSLPAGFERFPQVLGSTIPVAFGPAGSRAAVLEQAGDLVAGLQSMTPEQLTVSVIPLSTAMDSAGPAVIVGADQAITQDTGAPVVVGDVVVLRDAREDDRAAGQIVGPLAVAQAFQGDGRDVVLLGPLPSDVSSTTGGVASGLATDLAVQVATGPARWAALIGRVMVLGSTGQLENIRVPDPPSEEVSTVSLALVFGGITALIVLGLILWSRRKPKTVPPPLPGDSSTGTEGPDGPEVPPSDSGVGSDEPDPGTTDPDATALDEVTAERAAVAGFPTVSSLLVVADDLCPSEPSDESVVPVIIVEPSIEEPVAYLTAAKRALFGRDARKHTPRRALAVWEPAPGRPDPVALLLGQEASRVEELLSLRHARMSASALAFFRGSALVMASDLSTMPRTGIDSQLCGDAHLANFGLFAAPDRALVFDLNDFDETHPGPFEWDVKRLATSFVLAVRGNRLPTKVARAAAEHAAQTYRTSMAAFASMRNVDMWYERVDLSGLQAVLASLNDAVSGADRKKVHRFKATVEESPAQARKRTAWSAISKMTELVDGQHQFRNQPPLLTRVDVEPDARALVDSIFREYRSTPQDDRSELLETYDVIDVGHKLVGVGSVGSVGLLSFVLLMRGRGRDEEDLMVLQVKQAQPSVLEPFTHASEFASHGHRVVSGQRLMQAASDSFLGWVDGPDGRSFYVRQLRDMRWSPDLTSVTAKSMILYAQICGHALARSHARSGDAVAMASYLGSGQAFDRAIADFALSYSHQVERDFALFTAAIAEGLVTANPDVPGSAQRIA